MQTIGQQQEKFEIEVVANTKVRVRAKGECARYEL